MAELRHLKNSHLRAIVADGRLIDDMESSFKKGNFMDKNSL